MQIHELSFILSVNCTTLAFILGDIILCMYTFVPLALSY